MPGNCFGTWSPQLSSVPRLLVAVCTADTCPAAQKPQEPGLAAAPSCLTHAPIPDGSCPHVFWPRPSILRADVPCWPLLSHSRPGVCPSPGLLPGAAGCRLQSSHPLPALFLPQTMLPIQPPASPSAGP